MCSQNDTDTFHTTWISRTVDVQPLFNIASKIEPDQSSDCQFALNVSVNNTSSAPVRLTQMSTVSPSWRTSLMYDKPLYVITPALLSELTNHLLNQAHALGCPEL